MQLDKKSSKENMQVNLDVLKQKIQSGCDFITGVFNRIPSVRWQGAQDDDDLSNSDNENVADQKTSRANTYSELQQRMQDLKAKKKQGYRDIAAKKALKNKLKKKRKADERNLKHKQMKLHLKAEKKSTKGDASLNVKPTKPVFNSEGKMVFSKFDFSELGSHKDDKKTKETRNAKKILEKMKEKKEKIKKLQAEGQTEKALEMKSKDAWGNAFKKAEGMKVKDDPELLKKTMQREASKKRQSAKKWASREHSKKKVMEERLNKRNSNIQARKDLVKKQKKAKAVKKGRIVPGF